MKLTPWFSGTVKPVREGVYERDYNVSGLRYAYWNGEFWGRWATTPRGAVRLKTGASPWQNLSWRGVEK